MQGSGKKITKYDEDGFRTAEFAKGDYEVLDGNADDLTAVVNIGLEGLKTSIFNAGRPPVYEPTEEGLQAFYDKTIAYFSHINNVNSNPDIQKKVIPDIESWCTYLGITRMTLSTYYRNRNDQWQYVIDYAKQVITSGKKQLAATYRIPPMFAVFDLINNTDNYRSTNEYHVIQDYNPVEITERNNIRQQIAEAGLVWNEDTQSFEERK